MATIKNNETSNSDKILQDLSKEMLRSTGDYIKSEIDMCVADYKVLEKMNRSVEEKYKNLSSVSGNINIEMEKLNEKYVNLLPLLSQIDEVELCVTELEASAGKLDVYSKKLETKFKQFIEKNNSK